MKNIVMALMTVFFLSACLGESQSIRVENAWMKAPAGSNGAAFMQIHNDTEQDVSLIAVKGDVAAKLEIHTMSMNDKGIMQMRPLKELVVPANGYVSLQPMGNHVMLMGMKNPVKEGDTVALSLVFNNKQTLDIAVAVKPVLWKP